MICFLFEDNVSEEKPLKKKRKKKEPFVISLQVVQDNMVVPDSKINFFSQKNFYVGKRLKGDAFSFYQLIGNLGCGVDLSLSDSLDYCVISDKSYSDLCDGIKDETLLSVEKFVDSKSSKLLLFKFITESEFLAYYVNRMNLIEDSVVTECYKKYINS